MPRQQTIGVEVREVGGGCGLGVVATAPLPQGTVVLQERPYATALLPSLCPVACRTCFAPIGPASKGLQTCGRCRAAHYCSYKCLRLDRRPHRESGECWTYAHAPALTLAAPEELHREVCLALRHMHVQEGEGQQQQQERRQQQPLDPHTRKTWRENGHQGRAQDQEQQQQQQDQQQLQSNASVLSRPLHGELCAWQEAALSRPGLEALRGAVGPRAGLGLLAGLMGAAAQAGLAERAARLHFEARREQARQQRQAWRQQRKQQQQQQQQQHEGKQQRMESQGGQEQEGKQQQQGGQGPGGEGRKDSKSESESDTDSDSDTDYEVADVVAGVGARVPNGRERQPQRPPQADGCNVDGQEELDPWAGGAWAAALSTRAVAAGPDAAAAAAAAAALNAPPPYLEPLGDPVPPANAVQHQHDQQDNQQRDDAAAEGSCDTDVGGGGKRSSGSWGGVGGGGVWARAAEALCVVLTNALEVHPQLQPPAAAGLMGTGQGARQGPAGAGAGTGPGREVPAAAAERLSAPLALYRLACRLNHSCRPNAAYHFRPGGAVLVRTLRAVPRGDQVAIAYVDLAQTRAARTEELRTKYGFRCRCERCGDGACGSADGRSGTESEGGYGPTSLSADQMLAGLLVQAEDGSEAKGEGEGEVQGLHGVVQGCEQRLRQAGGDGELVGGVYQRLLAGLEEAVVPLEGCRGRADGPEGAAAGWPVRGGRTVPQSRCCMDVYTLAASAARRCARLAREQRAGTGAGGCRGPAGAADGSGAEEGGGAGPGAAAGAGPLPLEVRWWMRAACSSLAGAAAAERLLGAEPALLQHAACAWGDAASTACELLSALFRAAASPAAASALAAAAAAAPAATDAASVPAMPRSQAAAAPAPLMDELVSAVRAALEQERSEQLASCPAAARARGPQLHASGGSDEGGGRGGEGKQGATPGRKRPAEDMHLGGGVGGGDGSLEVAVGKRLRADGEEDGSRGLGAGTRVAMEGVKGSRGREEGGGGLWPRYTAPPVVAYRMRRLFLLCSDEGAWGSVWDGGSCQPAVGRTAICEVALHQQQLGEERGTVNSAVVQSQGSCRALLAAVDDWCCWVDQEHRGPDAKAPPPHGGALPLAAVAAAAAVALCHALARVRLLLVALLGEAHGCCEAAHFMPFFAQDVPYHVAAELCELAATLLDTAHSPYMGAVHVRARMHGQAENAD